MSDDDTQPIHHRSRGHGSGLHAKVEGLRKQTETQLDRIERNLERSLGELREMDGHLIELRVTLEGVSKRIDEVRADHDRRLEDAATRHGKLTERVAKVEQDHALLGQTVKDLEERVGNTTRSGVSVKAATTYAGGAGLLGALLAELARIIGLGGGGH